MNTSTALGKPKPRKILVAGAMHRTTQGQERQDATLLRLYTCLIGQNGVSELDAFNSPRLDSSLKHQLLESAGPQESHRRG